MMNRVKKKITLVYKNQKFEKKSRISRRKIMNLIK